MSAALYDLPTRKPHWRKADKPDLYAEHGGPRPLAPQEPSFRTALRKAAGRRS